MPSVHVPEVDDIPPGEIETAIKGQTIATRLYDAGTDHPDKPAMSWLDADGAWQTMTWSAVRSDALALAAAMVDLGLQPADTVALMMPNCPEHLLADQAALHAGGVALTVYATLADPQVAWIADDASVKLAVLQGADQLQRWQSALAADPEHGGPAYVVVVDPDAVPDGPRFLSYAELLRRGRAASAETVAEVDRRWRALEPGDTLTLLYTSGTTGTPKGVPLTHRNALWEGESVTRGNAMPPHPVGVSYLPYAHVAERNLGLYIPIALAGHVWLCPDPTQLATVLRAAQPTSFFGVPRIWEKLQAGLAGLLALEPDETKKAAVAAAMAVGRRYVLACENGGVPDAELETAYAAADAQVLAPIRGLMGFGRTEVWTSGSAPLPPAVVDFFAGLGIPLCDVYGMTETNGAVTANRPGAFKLGTVGQTIPGCEASIAADGEILLRGPVCTAGYRGRPDLTAELLDAEGWVHTGDIGTIDGDGYVSIVDRKKELLITSGGENVAPAGVENVLKEHPLVGQALAYGDGRRYVSALVTLDPDAAAVWARSHGREGASVAELATDPEILAEVEAAVAQANLRLARVQQVKRYTLLPAEWTAESGELTPTLKLKRRVIHERYADEIDALYREEA